MDLEIELRNGDESWPQVAELFEQVWAPIKQHAEWKHVRWANADLRILLEPSEGGVVCHAGLYFREVIWNGQKLHIGGIGGVATHPEFRRRGYASMALDAAIRVMRDRKDVHFALLFCEPHNEAFYRARGWQPFAGEIFVQQPEGRVSFSAMSPFVFDMNRSPRRGTIDLCGLPW